LLIAAGALPIGSRVADGSRSQVVSVGVAPARTISRLDSWLTAPGRSFTLLGYSSPRERFGGLSLSDLMIPPGAGLFGDDGAPIEGPAQQYVNVALGEDRIATCVQTCNSRAQLARSASKSNLPRRRERQR